MASQASKCKIVEVGGPTNAGANIAVVCMKAQHDKASNLAKYARFVEAAGEKRVHLLVFPEQTLMGYIWEREAGWALRPEVFQHHYENAETVPGPATNTFSEYANRFNMHIILGMTEKNPRYGGGTAGLFNSAVLIGPNGVIGIHRKVHLPGAERHIYHPGTSFRQYQIPVGKIGMVICYDILFPESCRVHAIGGADIIAFSAAWPSGLGMEDGDKPAAELPNPVYHATLTTRAVENQVWLLAAATTGIDDKQGWEYFGHAKIIDPDGETLVETGSEEGIAIGYGLDIPGRIREARQVSWLGECFLFDRNPQLYEPIARSDIVYPSHTPEEPMFLEKEEVQQTSRADESA